MMVFWLGPILALLLPGCGNRPECSDAEACSFGFACVEGRCEERRCATSAQCSMEHYCQNGACNEGCASDEDCYPGDSCDLENRTCQKAACSDQHEDCAFKEFCNAATGECYEAAGYYCRSCNTEEDCGGGDNHCVSGYCSVSCQDGDDCPAGFDCMPFVDYNGNIQFYQCYTYCWLYEGFDSDDLDAVRPAVSLPPVGPVDPAAAAGCPAEGAATW